MKGYILLGLIFLLPVTVIGQYTSPDLTLCVGIKDFEVCRTHLPPKCSDKSKCYCKDNKAFCRCNNYINTWYIGENCDFEWTILTFALVATLPGLALAAIVGVTVQCVHYSRKPAEKQKDRTVGYTNNAMSPTTYDRNNQDDMFTNTVFASDMPNRPKPSSIQPTQERFPMANLPNSPYSPQPNGMRPTLDRSSLTNLTSQPYSPSPNSIRPSLDRSSLAYPPSQPYNYATGMTQPLGNPYPKSPSPRNPYEDRAPPPDRYDDQHMRPTQPPPGYNGMMREGMSGYPVPSSPAPLYSAAEYNPRSQFPRAQMGRLY
uniref:pollen-specific leucine-rich repeat extensin-like protein 2 n=1 Tax=Oncorhynchus gorbuscha TaxID=8017 RepID=UPI001EAF3C1D|nr:pollen-specific leucine-rich repeat extensin-like protein 2 [Oncorhynchus gorbuscha]